jgi:hypothetical protein
MNKLVAMLFLLGCLSCTKRIDFGPHGEISDARTLVSLVHDAERRVASLQGDGKLVVQSPQGSGTLDLFVAVQRPESIHLESMDFFGKPLAVLSATGGQFGLYQGQENRFYEGPASPANVSRLLPVVLPPSELVTLFTGSAPLLDDPNPHMRLAEGDGEYELVLDAPPFHQTVRVQTRTLRITRSEVKGGGGYDVTLADFQDYGALSFPGKITLAAPSAKTELTLRYTRVSLNAPVDAHLFGVRPPEGVPVVEVDALGNPVSPNGAQTPSR